MRYILLILILLVLLPVSWGGAVAGTIPDATVYLPFIQYIPALPHKALNSEVGNPTCEDYDRLGAERLMMWWPTCEIRCDRPFNPMVRDLSQLEVMNLNDCGETVIGFNEPENQDCGAGACMTLAELMQAWHRLEMALPDKQLTSPQFVRLTDMAAPAYTLNDFTNAYGGEPFDVIAVHFYGRYDVERSLQQWRDWYATLPTDRPMWVTELGWHDYSGWQNGEDEAAEFLSLFLLDCQEKNVELVNWFGVKESSDYPYIVPLLRADGELTGAGQVWAGW
jgi:hypothetical protein